MKSKISNSDFLSLSADIAEELIGDTHTYYPLGKSGSPLTFPPYITDENGDVRYTDAAQDMFNDLNDRVQDILSEYLEVTQ